MTKKRVNPADFIIGKLSDNDILPKVTDWIESGCMPLDIAMGGGWPCGRICELYGGPAAGKTALAVKAIAEAQRAEYPVYFASTELAEDVTFFTNLGARSNNFMIEHHDTLEQVMDGNGKDVDDPLATFGINGFIKWKDAVHGQHHPAIIVWDSIAATATKNEIDSVEAEGSAYPEFAKHFARVLRYLHIDIARSNICFIMVNQLKKKIDIMWGDKDSTYGGDAPAFYSTLRVKLNSTGKIKDKGRGKIDVVIGEHIHVVVKKNKLTSPFRECKYDFYYRGDIDEVQSIVDILKDFGLATQSGQNITIKDTGETLKKSEIGEWLREEKNYNYIWDLVEDKWMI